MMVLSRFSPGTARVPDETKPSSSDSRRSVMLSRSRASLFSCSRPDGEGGCAVGDAVELAAFWDWGALDGVGESEQADAMPVISATAVRARPVWRVKRYMRSPEVQAEAKQVYRTR